MKNIIISRSLIGAALLCTWISHGALLIPGANGSDGSLTIRTNTVIDLSKAVTDVWDADNSANAGKGVYDSNKWAIVFKYVDVTVASNANVTFVNHPSRAPVVWLVSGSVTIDGVVNVSGGGAAVPPANSEPGPGGFRGGTGRYSSGVDAGSGFGLGGGWKLISPDGGTAAQGASYGSAGGANIPAYGNPSLIPLLGGSGGSGSTRGQPFDFWPIGGGAGGGAILLACRNTVRLTGSIVADGGRGFDNIGTHYAISSAGSGGGIRLVCSSLEGNGTLSAVGGAADALPREAGGVGRIRIERVSNANSLKLVPDPSVVDLVENSTALLWPPAFAPEVRVLSIGNTNAPADPRAGFGAVGADVTLPLTQNTPILIETKNVEKASQVLVRLTPRYNVKHSEIAATVQSIISNDPLIIRWSAILPVTPGYSAVQVKVVRP